MKDIIGTLYINSTFYQNYVIYINSSDKVSMEIAASSGYRDSLKRDGNDIVEHGDESDTCLLFERKYLCEDDTFIIKDKKRFKAVIKYKNQYIIEKTNIFYQTFGNKKTYIIVDLDIETELHLDQTEINFKLIDEINNEE